MPALHNLREIRHFLKDANQRATHSGRVELDLLVTEDGIVGTARMAKPSGYRFLDAVLIGIATRMQFHPALIDR